MKTLGHADVIRTSNISSSNVNRTILAKSQIDWCGAIYAIFQTVEAHTYFVAHTQNLSLNTLGHPDVIKDKICLSFHRQQKHISQISNCLVSGNISQISSCCSSFLFVAHTYNLPLKTLGWIDVTKDKLFLDFHFQKKHFILISSRLVKSNLSLISSCGTHVHFVAHFQNSSLNT